MCHLFIEGSNLVAVICKTVMDYIIVQLLLCHVFVCMDKACFSEPNYKEKKN